MHLEKQFQEVLTATVSHEMKTPLNSIISTGEQLVKNSTDKKT